MKWLDIVNAWTWPHISDAEFIAAAELLGPLHVHAARTLIQKTSRRIRTIIKINFAFSGMKRTVTEFSKTRSLCRYRRLLAILM